MESGEMAQPEGNRRTPSGPGPGAAWWPGFAAAVAALHRRRPDPSPTAAWVRARAVAFERVLLVTGTPARWSEVDGRGLDHVVAVDPSSLSTAAAAPWVVVDEVVAAVADPHALVAAAGDRVSTDGSVSLLVPLDGVRHPALIGLPGPAGLLDLLGGRAVPEELGVDEDADLCWVTGRPSADGDARRNGVERTWRQARSLVDGVAGALGRARIEGDRVSAQWRGEAASGSARADELADLGEQTAKLERQRDIGRRKVAKRDRRIAELEERLSVAEQEASRASKRLQELESDLGVERWRREQLYAGRWWRMGEVLRSVKEQPARLPSAATELVDIVRRPAPRPPHPSRPAGAGDGDR